MTKQYDDKNGHVKINKKLNGKLKKALSKNYVK